MSDKAAAPWSLSQAAMKDMKKRFLEHREWLRDSFGLDMPEPATDALADDLRKIATDDVADILVFEGKSYLVIPRMAPTD